MIAPGKGYPQTRVQQCLAQLASNRHGEILIRNGMKPDYGYRFSDALMQPFIVMRAIKDGMIDDSLRHLLFHRRDEHDGDDGHQLGIATPAAEQRAMIIPGVAEEAGAETPRLSEVDPALPDPERTIVSESRQARTKLGLHPANAGLSGAVSDGSPTATLSQTRERSWRLFRR